MCEIITLVKIKEMVHRDDLCIKKSKKQNKLEVFKAKRRIRKIKSD